MTLHLKQFKAIFTTYVRTRRTARIFAVNYIPAFHRYMLRSVHTADDACVSYIKLTILDRRQTVGLAGFCCCARHRGHKQRQRDRWQNSWQDRVKSRWANGSRSLIQTAAARLTALNCEYSSRRSTRGWRRTRTTPKLTPIPRFVYIKL